MKYNCNKCNKIFSKKSSLISHEKWCDGFGTKLDKIKKNKILNWICPKCHTHITSQNKDRHFKSCDGTGIKRTHIQKKKHICIFCNKEFERGVQLGSHIRGCKLNPKFNDIQKKIYNTKKKNNSFCTDLTREKIKATINEKIKNGKWHNSFSKARTYEYNGEKYYGKWELNYAIYLDKTLGKNKWKKNRNKFYYFFNNENHFYTPDFYLIEDDCYIEIKGYETEKDRAKWKQFPHKLKVLKGKELYELGIISSYKKLKTDIVE